MREDYASVKVGDEIVEFTYWNTRPNQEISRVTGITEHFVEVESKGFFTTTKRLISRQSIEVIKR